MGFEKENSHSFRDRPLAGLFQNFPVDLDRDLVVPRIKSVLRFLENLGLVLDIDIDAREPDRNQDDEQRDAGS